MKKKLTQNDMYYQILRDFQILVQKCYEYDLNENADLQFENLVKPEVENMCRKYYKTEFNDFVFDLIGAHLKDMERRRKNGKNMSNMQ